MTEIVAWSIVVTYSLEGIFHVQPVAPWFPIVLCVMAIIYKVLESADDDAGIAREAEGIAMRAHKVGCGGALDTPVDLCTCGGRDFPDPSADRGDAQTDGLLRQLWEECYGPGSTLDAASALKHNNFLRFLVARLVASDLRIVRWANACDHTEDMLTKENDDLRAKLAAADAQGQALLGYVQHKPECHLATDGNGEYINCYRPLGGCDCGLDALTAATRPAPEK